MVDAEMYEKEKFLPKNLLNKQEGNLRDGEFWVDINDNRDYKSELKRTVNELISELRKVKEDNERILKAQEELNTILLEKIHNEEKDKIRNISMKCLKLHLTNVRVERWNF